MNDSVPFPRFDRQEGNIKPYKPLGNEGFRAISQMRQAGGKHGTLIKPIENEGFRAVFQIWQAGGKHKTL